jgi:Immunity protein 50
MWASLIENSQAITSLFADAPSLIDVRLMRVLLLEDGPTVDLSFSLHDHPSKPPIRWKQRSEYNAVALTLQLVGAEQISIMGFSTNNIVTVRLHQSGLGSLQVSISGGDFQFTAQCFSAKIARVAPYTYANESRIC